jgi:hypothetical protein
MRTALFGPYPDPVFSKFIILAADNYYSAPFDTQPAGGKEPNCLGIGLAFLFKNPSRQRIRRIVLPNGHGPLQYDGSMIVLIIREMNGAAADLYAVSQGRLMHVMAVVSFPTEGRDQRRMDIHHPAIKVIGDAKELKKPGQADQIDTRMTAALEYVLAEIFARGVIGSLNHGRWHAGALGTHQSEGIGVAGDNQVHLCRQTAVGDLVEQVLQRGAAAAEKDRQA